MPCCGGTAVEPLDGEKKKTASPMGIKHRCTDVFWLLLFFLFWAGMGAIAYLSIRDGEPERLVYGDDSYGNICGQNNSKLIDTVNSGLDLTNRTYVFYYNPTNSDAVRLCVEACPNGTITSDICLTAPYTARPNDTYYAGDADFNINSTGCPDEIDTMYIAALHRCVPSSSLYLDKAQQILSQADSINAVVDELSANWLELLYVALIAFGIAIAVVFLLSCIAKLLIWLAYIASMCAIIAFIGYMWYTWYTLTEEYNATPDYQKLQSQEDNISFYYKGGIAVSVIGGVILLILIVLRSRIALVVALFKEAGRAIRKMPMLLVQPIFTFVAILGAVGYFLYVYAYLYTVGTKEMNNIGHMVYTKTDMFVYMQWYHIFGFFWTYELFLAVQEMTVAGAVVKWYFTRDKGSISCCPNLSALARAIWYHLGSLAFGSLIIAIVKMLRLILAYVEKKFAGKTSSVAKVILKCCQCCLWLMEKCLKYLNRNAYIEISIYSYNFCRAAREAFTLLVRNALTVATINSVGDFVLFLCKLMTAGLSGVVALYWFRERTSVSYIAVFVVIVTVIAYLVACIFTSIYEMAVDTIFVCFAEDKERNDGSIERPVFMSTNLQQVFIYMLGKDQEDPTQKNSLNEVFKHCNSTSQQHAMNDHDWLF
eukprot:m.49727 g.49727  ORF g.49727 m.49727 type:complete len:652 (+) comp11116_c0_seq1:100-2055(+)